PTARVFELFQDVLWQHAATPTVEDDRGGAPTLGFRPRECQGRRPLPEGLVLSDSEPQISSVCPSRAAKQRSVPPRLATRRCASASICAATSSPCTGSGWKSASAFAPAFNATSPVALSGECPQPIFSGYSASVYCASPM